MPLIDVTYGAMVDEKVLRRLGELLPEVAGNRSLRSSSDSSATLRSLERQQCHFAVVTGGQRAVS